jgi:CCR4-NOT transcription complex subunit 4
MSTAAKALLDDVKARWKTHLTTTNTSPFPDLDRTLQTLSAGDGQYSGFSFNLDPKLASGNDDAELPDFEAAEANTPFKGTYLDAFPGLKVSSTSFMAPPGSPYPHTPIRSLFDQTGARPLSAISIENPHGSGYKGSFNPFAENHDAATSTQSPRPSPFIDDGERKMSRFGFAQGRKGSTAASSPMTVSSPLSDGQALFYTPAAEIPPPPTSAQSQWLPPTSRSQYSEFAFPASTAPPTHTLPSPSTYPQSPSRFQPFESSLSESQLRDLIQTNRVQNEPPGKRFPFA